jgi:Carboxypeptidase regulatory-like domain/TonB dependent receptor
MLKNAIRLLTVWFVLGAAATTMYVSTAWAQGEQATITGIVTDESGAVIPNARVAATNIETRVTREAQTNGEGQYRVPYLSPGRYQVTVESQGFGTAQVEVSLTLGLTATINVLLKAGAVTETVMVEAGGVELERQTASLGNVLNSQQIIELPLLDRNPYSLVTLAPGVVDRVSSGNPGTGPIINGGRSNTSEVLLDGAESRNSTTNDINYNPPLETVQEVKVITNNMSAEFGRSGGGVILAATRSGTNQWHGSLYEFLRNDKLNANSWSNNRVGLPRSPFHKNQYGGTFGGPVLLPRFGEGGHQPGYSGRNRTFFFVAFEQTKQRVPDDLIANVPTLLQRGGPNGTGDFDFSQTFDASGNLVKIYDPATSTSATTPRTQFSCNGRLNVICRSRVDPVAARVLAFYPLPNRSTQSQNFVQTLTRSDDATKVFFRIDHSFGKHHLFFTGGRQDNPRSTPGVNIAFPGEGVNGEKGTIESHPRTAVLSDTITFRPDLVGEFRASITRNVIKTQPRSAGFDLTQLGFPQSLKDHEEALIFPRFVITDLDNAGSSLLGPDRASFFTDAEFAEQFQGHFTWVRGNHTIKSGVDFTFMAFNVNRPERPSGLFNFTRAFTQGPLPSNSSTTSGHGFATFLLGPPTSAQITIDPTLAASQKFYSFYVNDEWKVRRNLTFTLGVRWEYQTPWTDRFNQLAYFDPNVVEPLSKRNGLLRFVGRDGNSRYQSNPDKNNFAPRVGLAWQFRQNTVLRLGYGIFYYPGSGGIGSGSSDLGAGFLATTSSQSLAVSNTPNAGATLANSLNVPFVIPPSTLVGNSLTTAYPVWVTPFNQQWNLSIQRLLTTNTLLEVAYIGSRGEHIWINRNLNAVSASYLSLGTTLDSLVPNPFVDANGNPLITTGSAGRINQRTITFSQLLRPFPQYGDITRFRDPAGDSIYHGATLRINRRLATGLTLQVAYTASKMIDNMSERFSGRTSFIDPNNLSLSRSVSDEDRSRVFQTSYVYQFPFGKGQRWLRKGLLSSILGNWQTSGVVSLLKGRPVIITGTAATHLPGVSATAVRLYSPVLPAGQQTLDRWFDTGAFMNPAPFTLGNDSRTQPNLRGPGEQNFNLSLSRSQRIKEGVNMQFRAEFFNALNHPRYGEPVGNVNDNNYGKIITGTNPRQIQFGLRLSF